MRILVIGWFAGEKNSGGMEVHIRQLCKNLVPLGHSVELVVPESARGIMEITGAIMQSIPCEINCGSFDDVVKSVSQYNKNTIAILGNRKFGFDVIHSHDWLGVEAANYLKEKLRKPWIHTVHSLEHIRATEDTGSVVPEIEKLGINNCDRIIAVSSLMKKEILKKYGIKSDKISVTYNYTSFDTVAAKEKTRRPADLETKHPIVLYVGRLALQKGVEHLILAFKNVLERVPSAKLVIVGDGNLDNGLKSLVLSLGIENSVIFKGFVSEEELKELYRNATLFVSPSVFEPFGITILDAVRFNVPVIATKNTGCLELFSKKSIAVVAPENSEELAEKIISLLNDKLGREKMAESAKKDFEKADDWKLIAEKTANAYIIK